jgi:hypothetical protein
VPVKWRVPTGERCKFYFFAIAVSFENQRRLSESFNQGLKTELDVGEMFCVGSDRGPCRVILL